MAMIKVNAVHLWKESTRPLVEKVHSLCTKDTLLTMNLESLLIKVDTDIMEGRPFYQRLEGLIDVIGSPTYIGNTQKETPDDQIKMLKQLLEEFKMLHAAARVEPDNSTNKRDQKLESERLPNPSVTQEQVYGTITRS